MNLCSCEEMIIAHIPSLDSVVTIIEAGLKIRLRPIFHQLAFGLVSVESDLGGLGADCVNHLTQILVFPIVLAGEVVVGVGRMQIEPTFI